MQITMIILVWILNFAISWLNAWGCGKSWNETRAAGGGMHLLNWCGAIMSAAGFTWCYLVIAGAVGSVWPVEQDDGTMAPLLSQTALQAFADLGYLIIIGPILGTGIIIMLNSWAEFWRRRTFGSGVVAGWNTFANVSNVYDAVQYVPKASKGVGSFFDSDSKDKGLVLFLVLGAALGGILTTRAIILSVMRSTAVERSFRYQEATS
jgi:hypothetical protein